MICGLYIPIAKIVNYADCDGSSVKVGVIGTGSMGKNHVRVLSEMEELAGVCDSSKEIGETVAARFKTAYFSNIDELIDSGVEAVSIVTPTADHYENARKAIEARVHTLLEKPATGSVDKLKELSHLAEKKGVVLAVGLIERHNPVVEFAASSLRSGSFGSLISVHARRVSSFPSRIRDVGVIMDLGVHDIDVIRYLVNSPATRVYAVSGKTKHPEFEDHANIVIEFENGVTGVIEVNWLTPMKVRMMSMTCIDRFVELDYVTQSVQVSYSELQEMDPEDLFHLGVEFHGKRITLKREEPLKRELADFIEAIDSGSGPLVTGFDAAKTLEIAHGSMISAAENRVVEL